jgi:hypothetical protein
MPLTVALSAKSSSGHAETVRTFWHGSSLGPYQLVGLRSFFDRGHRVELFTYDPQIAVPNWMVRREANEIWSTDHVMSYQRDLGRGSFALHANLFRYAMLHKLGGWWVDLDIVLLRQELPADEIFFAIERDNPMRATFSVLKFPSGHPALAEAVSRCVAAGEDPLYGETGPDLFTELVRKYNLVRFGQKFDSAYPISALDVPALFDPDQCDKLKQRCARSYFVHLFNETWRRAGIPRYLGPPQGSFIEDLLLSHDIDVPMPRMEFGDIKRWTAYLTLHDEFQAGLSAYRLANEALRSRVNALEKEQRMNKTSGSPPPAEDAEDELRELKDRIGTLEARTESIARAFSRLRHQRRRLWLRPPLWIFEQYGPKRLDISPAYQREKMPTDPISIAIVTPSFNHAKYLSATVDSVLTQNYLRLNYLVQDGGSSDNTVDILRSYGSRLVWRSARDDGQAQAINHAFATCKGDVMAYLNSDDMLLPGTLAYVASVFHKRPDVDFVYGHRIFVDRDGLEIGRAVLPRHDAKALYWADYIPQETMFWRRRVWDTIGPFNESFQYALDWDFILRAQDAGFKFLRVPRFLACFRVHDQQKTAVNYDQGREEMQRLRSRYLGREPTQAQIMRKMMPYLLRQFAVNWMHRRRILRY